VGGWLQNDAGWILAAGLGLAIVRGLFGIRAAWAGREDRRAAWVAGQGCLAALAGAAGGALAGFLALRVASLALPRIAPAGIPETPVFWLAGIEAAVFISSLFAFLRPPTTKPPAKGGRLFEAKSGDGPGRPIRQDSPARCVAISPDGTRVVSGHSDGKI